MFSQAKVELYLFGSMVYAPETGNDIDVVIFTDDDNEMSAAIETLRPFSLESGGCLDVFEAAGDGLYALYADRKIFMQSHSDWVMFKREAKKVTVDELNELMKRFNVVSNTLVRGEHYV